MKRLLSTVLALTMLLASLSATLSAQAATPNVPAFSTDSGAYTDSVTIVLRSGSLLNTVYYRIYEYGMNNHAGALKQDTTRYVLPFKITESCYIDAWSDNGDETSEVVTNRYYIRYSSDEGRFTVDEDGVLRGYTGNTPNLVIPDKVDGITVTKIGSQVFTQYKRDNYYGTIHYYNYDDYSNFLESVTLPDTCTEIEYAAFCACVHLKNVYGGNLKIIGDYAFDRCVSLESIDLSNTELIDRYAFEYNQSLKTVESDTVKTVRDKAFEYCTLERLVLPNLEMLGDGDIYSKYINIGKVEELRSRDQYHVGNRITTSTMLAPNLKKIGGTTIVHYASSPRDVIVPKLAGALGASIRLSDSGLRFGFNWDNGTDFQAAHGENMEYGFVYAYGRTNDLTVENGKTRIAEKRVDADGKTSFNLVFTDIPKANFDTEISARAYVRINGVYFYSDILTRSFEGVANAVLADPDIDENIKSQLRLTLEA